MPATASRDRRSRVTAARRYCGSGVAGTGEVATRDLRSRLAGWVFVAVAIALVAHGCHSGDHDFEPAVAHPAAE